MIMYLFYPFRKSETILKSLLNVLQALLMETVPGGGCVLPGFEQNNAANVGDYGSINKAGHKVYDDDVVNGGVRPVIHISVK